jgi:hypothetical protein
MGKHARDLSQGERRKRVTATLQRRAYRWRMGDLAQFVRRGGVEKDYLILKRASASRPSGEWNDDDFDVLASGQVVGRIFNPPGRLRLCTNPCSSGLTL